MRTNMQILAKLGSLVSFFKDPRYYPARANAQTFADCRNLFKTVDTAPEDPIKVLSHLDGLLRHVGTKLAVMESNPDEPFEASKFMRIEFADSRSLNLCRGFEMIRGRMDKVRQSLLGIMKVQWQHMQNTVFDTYGQLLDSIAD